MYTLLKERCKYKGCMKVAIIAEWVVHFFCNVATYIPAWTTNYLILVENVIFSRYREGLSLSVKVLLLEISLRLFLYSVFLILVLRVIIHWISVYSNYTNTRLQLCWYIYVLTIAIGIDGATGLAAVELLLFLSGSGVLEPDLRHSSADARCDGYSV